MDTTTAIIGIIILLICCMPFIYDFINRKKKEKEMINELSAYFLNLNTQTEVTDIDSSICFALDKSKKHFLFIRHTDKEFSIQHATIQEFNHVELQKMHAYSNKNNGHGPIEKISLKFTPISGHNVQSKSILLYDASKQTGIGSELQWAEKWVSILNGIFKNTSNQPVVEKKRL